MIIRSEFVNNSITLEQVVSLHKVYVRYINDLIQNSLVEKPLDFDAWIEKNVGIPSYDTCVMVQCGSIWLGIERDGYTHS